MHAYSIIDTRSWERAQHCRIFREYIEPAFCVTFEVDVANYLSLVRALDLSFTLAMVHAMCTTANSIEAFRYRFLDGQVVLFDRADTSFTYLCPDTQLFKVVRVPLIDSLKEYCDLAKRTADAQKEYFAGPAEPDVFQCSAIPWVRFSHISHTNSGRRDNATPMFDWGKYVREEARTLMPVSVQAHHSFVDGLHIGQFADRLQDVLDGRVRA